MTISSYISKNRVEEELRRETKKSADYSACSTEDGDLENSRVKFPAINTS